MAEAVAVDRQRYADALLALDDRDPDAWIPVLDEIMAVRDEELEQLRADNAALRREVGQSRLNRRPDPDARVVENLDRASEQLRELHRVHDRCLDNITTMRRRAEAAERTLTEVRRLVETAMHLCQHGEYAPGGTETWRQWYRDAEETLRAMDGDGQ